MEKKDFEEYNSKKADIKKRLQEFKHLTKDQQKSEFLFCLLTPQSNAVKCWNAVEQLKKLQHPKASAIEKILKTKTRFHNNKTKYILNAYKIWPGVEQLISQRNLDTETLRNTLASTVKGYGLKEASHFLRNIGKSNNEIAILDRHILNKLKEFNIVSQNKIKNKKEYLEIEKAYLNYAKKISIPADELDLLWWSNAQGSIFK